MLTSPSVVDLQLLGEVERSLLEGYVLQFGDSGFSAAVHEGEVFLRFPISNGGEVVYESESIGKSAHVAQLIAPYIQAMSDGERATLSAQMEMAQLRDELAVSVHPRPRLH